MSSFLIDYPFANRLYPGALERSRHVCERGPTVILSDGDVVFQPRKVAAFRLVGRGGGPRADLHPQGAHARRGRGALPGAPYVMVDDKLRILTAMKKVWGNRLTTVFPRQGHYAFDPRRYRATRPRM